MAKIRIGETTKDAQVKHSGKTLALTFEKADIEEIAALLMEDNAPEIRVLDGAGAVSKIYRNHALTEVSAETIGGKKIIHAVMQTDEIEKTQAETLAQQMDMLTQCVLEMSETVYA